jgi:hypothetical protein
MKRLLVLLMVAVLGAIGQARGLRSELDDLPPNVKWYLEQREKKDWFLQSGPFAEQTRLPDSQGLRLVAKWGRGPANKVTGRDSLVFMSLGSEVAVFSAPDGHHVRILAEIQCRNITGRLCLKDSLLFVGSQGPIEVWNVIDPTRPRFISYGPVTAPDISVQDSLVYALTSESLLIYNVTNPTNWLRLGATRDSGYAMNVADGIAYLSDRWGLYILDCVDPTNPHRAGILSGGREVIAAWSEGDYCYYTEDIPSDAFVVANVSDPYHPIEVGRRPGYASWDIHQRSFFVYLAGFAIMDVSQPSSPGIISTLAFEGNKNGVWTRSPYSLSFVGAGFQGLTIVNISDPVHPARDTFLADAQYSQGIDCTGGLGYLANGLGGLKILQLNDTQNLGQIGCYDTVGSYQEVNAAAVRDSLAYVLTHLWSPYNLRTVNVSDPERPTLTGGCLTFNAGEATVVRDTLAYVAEDYRFEIFSIANPRAPRLVGSCAALDMVGGLCLQGDYAYEESGFGLGIIDISDPANPRLISTTPGHPTNSWGIAVRDSFAYVPSAYDSLWVFNVGNPLSPFPVAHVWLGNSHGYDVALDGSLAYVGCYDLRVFDISDPLSPVRVGYYSTPGRVRRVTVHDGLVYAACFGAGVGIFETTNTAGIADSRNVGDRFSLLSVFPNPAGEQVTIRGPASAIVGSSVRFYDATGKVVLEVQPRGSSDSRAFSVQADLQRLPAGTYFVRLEGRHGRAGFQKLVKVDRR